MREISLEHGRANPSLSYRSQLTQAAVSAWRIRSSPEVALRTIQGSDKKMRFLLLVAGIASNLPGSGVSARRNTRIAS